MKHLIIGNGIAGISVAETIRKNRADDQIVIISDEDDPPYWRAGLSKYNLDIIPSRRHRLALLDHTIVILIGIISEYYFYAVFYSLKRFLPIRGAQNERQSDQS